MGCGSSSDTTRQPQPQQHNQHQHQNPAVQPQHGQPPYPAAVLVHPYPPQGQAAFPTAPQQAPYQAPPPAAPVPVFPNVAQQHPPGDASRGFRGHGGVATDADGWEHYDPSAFGGQPGQGGGPQRGAANQDDDAALAQAIARSLASAEEEQRQLRRAGGGAHRPHSPPPPLPGRQHSAQVAFMTAPNEPFIDADLQLMPRVAYCAGGAEDDDEGRQCALCFEDYADEPDAPLMLLPCFHRFHWKCAADWLKRKPECPVCKSNAKHTGASAILC